MAKKFTADFGVTFKKKLIKEMPTTAMPSTSTTTVQHFQHYCPNVVKVYNIERVSRSNVRQPGATDIAQSFLACDLTRGAIICGSTMREENPCLLRRSKTVVYMQKGEGNNHFYKYRFKGK
jgi:hypothetical protein